MGIFDDYSNPSDRYVDLRLMGYSHEDIVNLTGDDTVYADMGYLDEDHDTDEMESELEAAGLSLGELDLMDDDERREVLEEAGIDPDDFDDSYLY